ncbi:MAG TPA: hypothetical protein VHW09_02175 [Bryobacteraceae bacterium]|jgi:flagellar basal body rod protein FlgF|nr:hypothetical protein [Bryobacteraceae bacterium]
MDIFGIAQQGLQQAQGQFDQAAQHIAQSGLNPGSGQPAGDSVSLSDDAVSLMTAKNQFEADLGLAHTADEMQKATLNLLA